MRFLLPAASLVASVLVLTIVGVGVMGLVR